VPGLAVLHAWLAAAAAIVAAGTGLLGALVGLGVAGGRPARLWLDRLVLMLLVIVAANVALGGLVAIVGAGDRSGPADPLHFLYAVLALGAVPVCRFQAERSGSTRVGWWVCAGGLVTLGALLRLWATGG
jgi:hypothetical protein